MFFTPVSGNTWWSRLVTHAGQGQRKYSSSAFTLPVVQACVTYVRLSFKDAAW